MAELQSTRRGILGAMASVPVLAAVPAAAFIVSTRFDQCISRFDTTWLALRSLPDDTPEAIGDAAFDEWAGAAKALENCPAQSLRDFARKFVRVFDDPEAIPPEDAWNNMLADAHRLTAQ